jgi:hypothetical protein
MDDIFSFNRAYLIRFKKLDDSSYLDNYIFPNLAHLLSESGKNIAVEEGENGHDVMVLFIDDNKLQPVIEFCSEEEIIFEHYDITESLLRSENLPEVVLEMVSSDEFEEVFNQFFIKNSSVDTVLDKISKKGKESLTAIDKQILKNG